MHQRSVIHSGQKSSKHGHTQLCVCSGGGQSIPWLVFYRYLKSTRHPANSLSYKSQGALSSSRSRWGWFSFFSPLFLVSIFLTATPKPKMWSLIWKRRRRQNKSAFIWLSHILLLVRDNTYTIFSSWPLPQAGSQCSPSLSSWPIFIFQLSSARHTYI